MPEDNFNFIEPSPSIETAQLLPLAPETGRRPFDDWAEGVLSASEAGPVDENPFPF